MLSIKSVNALSHYTDWTIAHVHGGALGWVGFMIFGMAYWLMPRLYQAPLWSPRLMGTHFWIGTVGILLYIIPIYVAGITQGLMWRAFDDKGILLYSFLETVTRLMPFYWARVLGGALFLAGAVMCAANMYMTWRARPKTYEEPVHQAPALVPDFTDPPLPPSKLEGTPVVDFACKLDVFNQLKWHRHWERLPLKLTIWTIVAVAAASLFEIIPTFVIKSNVKTIETVRPYTPLELAGRDLYVAEGCYNCHSQMIRPIHPETERYGEFSHGGEFVYDHPFQWGSRRIGPDVQRVGGKYSHDWHIRHLVEPRSVSPGSIMPNYAHLLANPLDLDGLPARVRAMAILGVPYGEDEIQAAADLARSQAAQIVAEIIEQDGPEALPPNVDLANTQMVAMVAYLQRLGTDLYATEASAPAQVAAANEEEGALTDAPH
jgi:cytochrome c oxidase cbb3-type subunit I/II